MATHQWFWLQRPQDEAYPSRWSRRLSSERGGRTSHLVSQRLSADRLRVRSWQVRPNYRIHWELSAENSVWTGENRNMGSELASDDTHCPDTRKRFPREQLFRRWLIPLTRQAPVHLLFKPMLKFLDEDRCFSDPALPHKLSGRCLCPRFEKNTRILSFCTSNSTIQLLCDLAQLMQQDTFWGYNPFSMMH